MIFEILTFSLKSILNQDPTPFPFATQPFLEELSTFLHPRSSDAAEDEEQLNPDDDISVEGTTIL